MLTGTGGDRLELSGGPLEQPKVMGITLKDEGEDGPRQSTTAREAYFVNFAKEGRDAASVPVMGVGGLRPAAAIHDHSRHARPVPPLPRREHARTFPRRRALARPVLPPL